VLLCTKRGSYAAQIWRQPIVHNGHLRGQHSQKLSEKKWRGLEGTFYYTRKTHHQFSSGGIDNKSALGLLSLYRRDHLARGSLLLI
jgi:hypothetical protein